MNKDIVRYLINKNIYTNINESLLIENNKKEKKLFKNIAQKSKNIDGKEINTKQNSNIKDNSNNYFKIKSKNDLFFESIVNKNKKKKPIFKKMKFLDIIKSYFCFKEKKIKLINLCNELVMRDLRVERILRRLYKLEKLFSLISRKKLNKLNLDINMEFREIYNYIKEINKESKGKKRKKTNKIISK